MTLRAFVAIITTLLLVGVIFSVEVAQTPSSAQDYSTPTPDGLLPFPTAQSDSGSRPAPRTLVPGVPVQVTPEPTSTPFLLELPGSSGALNPVLTSIPAVQPESFLQEPASINSYLGSSFAIIDSGDFISLRNAIWRSNSTPQTLYTIYLQSGIYNITQTMAVIGNVEIYGRGEANTTLRQIGQPPSMNGIFTVAGGRLKLDNMTIRDGVSQLYGGAGIWVQQSTSRLELSNSSLIV